jgi:hypothetical protein
MPNGGGYLIRPCTGTASAMTALVNGQYWVWYRPYALRCRTGVEIMAGLQRERKVDSLGDTNDNPSSSIITTVVITYDHH